LNKIIENLKNHVILAFLIYNFTFWKKKIPQKKNKKKKKKKGWMGDPTIFESPT
jgi:hypothetical protein